MIYEYAWKEGNNTTTAHVKFEVLAVSGTQMKIKISDSYHAFGNGTVVNNIASPDNFPAISTSTLGNGTIQFGPHYLSLENVLYLKTRYGERHAYEYSFKSVHFYFDKETGILLKESSNSGQLKSMNLTQTNIIGHKTANLTLYAFGAGIIATVIIVAVYLKKKY
ncbi:MAG: hypothetical protein GXO25_05495 [Euryarchaeota archaeon]|nr:hypothetical protein [Euryarchaeota archaeon]